jgi:transposase-like protein
VDEGVVRDWLEHPAVRVARTMSRWPEGGTLALLEELGKVLDAQEELRDKGIDFPTLAAKAVEVRVDGEESQAAKDAILWAIHSGLDPEVSARIFDLDVERVEAWRRSTVRNPDYPTLAILELHDAGMSVTAIANQLDVHRLSVRRTLERNGRTPRYGYTRLTAEQQDEVRDLKSRGFKLRDIAEKLGVTIDQVKSATRKRTEKAAMMITPIMVAFGPQMGITRTIDSALRLVA